MASSRLIPLIPCGTRFDAFTLIDGIPKYEQAAFTVSVFPVPVGPTRRIDSTFSPSSAV